VRNLVVVVAVVVVVVVRAAPASCFRRLAGGGTTWSEEEEEDDDDEEDEDDDDDDEDDEDDDEDIDDGFFFSASPLSFSVFSVFSFVSCSNVFAYTTSPVTCNIKSNVPYTFSTNADSSVTRALARNLLLAKELILG